MPSEEITVRGYWPHGFVWKIAPVICIPSIAPAFTLSAVTSWASIMPALIFPNTPSSAVMIRVQIF